MQIGWLMETVTHTISRPLHQNGRKRIQLVEEGVWSSGRGGEGIKTLITNYFSSLFTPVTGADTSDIPNHISPKVTMQMNEFLSAEFTPKEVKRAHDDIGDRKATGMDGFSMVFYKHYWRLVVDDVVHEVLHVL